MSDPVYVHSSERPLRLAYLFDQRLPCTATDTEQVLNTISALSRAGVDVTLVLPRDWVRRDVDADALRRYYQVKGDFKVVRLRSISPAPRGLLKPIHALRATLYACFRAWSKEPFDVLYTRNAPALVIGLMFGRRMMYETYRPWPVQVPILRPIFKWAMSRSRFLGASFHSEYARSTYEALGGEPTRLDVIHNGFDPDRFAVDPGKSEARARCGLSEITGTMLTYTGRVHINKGLGLVLDLAKRHPELTFVLVGSEGEGEVEHRASKISNVVIKPWITYQELPDYLFASDILLIPPSKGPLAKVGNTVLPMKLFQYLAAARPIFAPESPDTAELLSHRNSAYLVPADDLDAISKGLSELCSDEDLQARLGIQAKARSEELTWDARAQRIIKFYERIQS